MSDVRSMDRDNAAERLPAEWTGRPAPGRHEGAGLSPEIVVAGAVAVALGVLAWNHFGPDLVRYVKMERM